jgi:succinoglycan biosynthesis protein ExoA
MAQPFVSVLVPVRNEERYIERCLHSLAEQDYPRDRYEVIVIDGQSTDATRQILSRFAAESTLDLRMLRNPRRVPAAALNLGLQQARGDVIVRVDGHVTVAPDFLNRSVTALNETQADCVGGVIESRGDTPAGESIALAMSSRVGVGGANFRVGGEGPVDTVAFGAYRRDVFDRIGKFAEDIDKGEDCEFNYRLLDRGGTILLVPGIRSQYVVRGDLPSLWRQYYGYGRGKPEVLRRHPSQSRPRQLVPATFVSALTLSGLLALAGPTRPLRLVLAAYAAFALGASVVLAARHGWQHLPKLPAILASLHTAYGTGFIVGTLAVLVRTHLRTAPTFVRSGGDDRGVEESSLEAG